MVPYLYQTTQYNAMTNLARVRVSIIVRVGHCVV